MSNQLPLIIAGPMLRFVDQQNVTVWVVTSCSAEATLVIEDTRSEIEGVSSCQTVQVGERAFISLYSFATKRPLTAGEQYHYRFCYAQSSHQNMWLKEVSTLCYPEEQHPHFRWQPELTNVIHGSCRKPHHNSADSLVRVDKLIAQETTLGIQRPDLLLMSGDQIYADDVAGPMLVAIQQTIDALGLFHEDLDGALIKNSSELANHEFGYYQRQKLLPQIATNTALSKLFFGAKKKPVFTSVNAQNHLISSAEIIAMYLLVWSETCWQFVSLENPVKDTKWGNLFDSEVEVIEQFSQTLPQVRRALAHIPVYMIFDDHDVTDDWNLTRGWEQEVYGHPLSRRMVGNALVGYWLCQGWGNQPATSDPIFQEAQKVFTQSGLHQHDEFIQFLFDWEAWHYQLDTSPPVHVLDTRTRRWRSESSLNKPSGLMDWEALCEFQQGLIGHESVIVVSAAPIYGVKVIEVIQKMFTLAGKALTVDAENWMAHKGTASVILNIFRHYRTPPHFIILSGDVHYSFVYDVRLRFQRNSPRITQFTCSGIKNTFPDGLLRWLDRLNRWFYSASSPLNIFTRRRNMSVHDRHPDSNPSRTLLNRAAIGQLLLNSNKDNVQCKALCADGDDVDFPEESTD